MIASRRGKSGRGTRGMSRNVKGGRGKLICSHCGKEGHLQNRCYDLIGWPDKTANISSSDIPSNERTGSQLISDEEYQEFLRLKSNNHAQSSVSPRDTHISCYCDVDWAGSPIDRRSTTGFCISIGRNVVSWKSKKQNIVARSSAKAKYRAMASATCELIWVKQLIQELKFVDVQPMKLYCDNQATFHIASNHKTKHIEIDCHFVREKLLAKEISIEFVNSSNQLVGIFTKSLRGPQIQVICSKLGAYNLYAPT
ncbi:Copia protein, partial [Mucuna pruriens]